MDEKVGIGFVGYGYWGKNLLRNLLGLENVQVTGVCDKDQAVLDRMKDLYPSIEFMTSDYDEMIKRPDIKVVVIATPPASALIAPSSHATIICRCKSVKRTCSRCSSSVCTNCRTFLTDRKMRSARKLISFKRYQFPAAKLDDHRLKRSDVLHLLIQKHRIIGRHTLFKLI